MGLRKWFSGFLQGGKSAPQNVSTARAITGNLSGYITDLSQWQEMKDSEVYEQLYVWESEIGGGLDRLSTLVRQAFSGCVIKDVGDALDTSEETLKKEANGLFEELEYKNFIEGVVETLMIHGNVFILENDDKTLTILPNRYCCLIEGTAMAGESNVDKIIMNPTHLAFNEADDQELDIVTYDMEKITHIKYKDTPIFMKDEMGRKTFGVYSISPLHRTVLPTWWKRQLMILDVLLRWKMVPREHHKISSDIFSLAGRSGSHQQKIDAARQDAEKYLDDYVNNLKQQMPDQGYVTNDQVEISNLQIQRGTSYTDANPLLDQLNTRVMAGLNLPMSMVNGRDAGSYASELVISNYVTNKIIQIAERIKPLILKNLRARLPKGMPLEQLDLKIELTLANSKIELYRVMTIMASMGIFTDTEIREMAGWEPLTEEQREFLVQSRAKSVGNVVSDTMQGGSDVNPDYAETTHSNERHNRDASDNALRDE